MEGDLWEQEETGTLPKVFEDLKSEIWEYLRILTTTQVNRRKQVELLKGYVQVKEMLS